VLIQFKAVWLRPRVMKHFLHMNEGLIFVAIIGATMVWGILGALVIVPVMATIGKVGHYMRCRLLYLDPWPESDDVRLGENTGSPSFEGGSR
jgi:predicted PurR-regulated permease PerM